MEREFTKRMIKKEAMEVATEMAEEYMDYMNPNRWEGIGGRPENVDLHIYCFDDVYHVYDFWINTEYDEEDSKWKTVCDLMWHGTDNYVLMADNVVTYNVGDIDALAKIIYHHYKTMIKGQNEWQFREWKLNSENI